MNNQSMMQNRNSEQLIDAYGARLSAWLDPSANQVPADVMERLRASRMQAIAKRRILKIETATSVFANNASAPLGGDAHFGFWGRAAHPGQHGRASIGSPLAGTARPVDARSGHGRVGRYFAPPPRRGGL